jgi:hypothetical protein
MAVRFFIPKKSPVLTLYLLALTDYRRMRFAVGPTLEYVRISAGFNPKST